jgi:hypothetical protein
MKFILIISLSLVTLFFNSCSICSCKKVPCPEFNDNSFSQWFPYSSSQKIIFQNNVAFDTISFSDIQKSTSYEANKGCYNGGTGCSADCRINSNELFFSYNRKLQITIYIMTSFESSASQKNITLNFYQFACQANNIADTGLVITSPGVSSNYYPTLNIGNTAFNNVQLIKRDTTGISKNEGPYKIYLTKNIGIVAYEVYPELKTWIKK